MRAERLPARAVPAQRVAVTGRIDAVTVGDVREALRAAVDSGTGPLVVDLSGAHLADATGLGVLLGAHRRAQRRDRSMVLANVPSGVARLLALTRLSRVLPVER